MEGEIVSGIVRGLTGEAAKLFIHEANDLLNPWPELKKSILLCKKYLPPPSVSVKSTTAVSPVFGKKILHLQLDVEVDDAWEVGEIQQASASTMASAPPVMIQYAAAHLLVSAVLAVLWNTISEVRKKSKEEKKKKKKESDGGSGTGTGAGPIPTD